MNPKGFKWISLQGKPGITSQVLSAHHRLCFQQRYVYTLLAILSGSLLPIELAMNTQLAHSTHSILFSTVICALVGSLVLAGVLMTGWLGRFNLSGLRKAPWWSFLGSFAGIAFITSSVYFTAILGTTLTMALVICGQTLMGLVVDHYGWLNVEQRSLTPNRLIAGGLLIGSVFLMAV